MNSQTSALSGLALLAVCSVAASAQNFIQVGGTGIGTADSVLSGPGGSVSESITINQLIYPFQESQLRQTSIPSYAEGQIYLATSVGLANGQLSSSASVVTSATSNCGDLGCAEGESSGTITSRTTFRVDSPAVLYCQGVNSTQINAAADSQTAGGGAAASATADIWLTGAGVGTIYYRQMTASGPSSNNGLSVPAGGVARLLPGIDYRLDLTASSNGVASGLGSLGASSASATCTFWLAPDTCPTTTDPASFATCVGTSAAFSTTASGTGPFTYVWQFFDTNAGAWTPLNNGQNAALGLVAGATSPTLQISGVAAATTFLRCEVSNGCGTAISNAATLRVCAADFNCDGIVDFFDYLDFVAAFASQDPIADFNGDTVIDFFDYLDFVSVFAAPC